MLFEPPRAKKDYMRLWMNSAKQAAQSVDDGYNYIILSDRGVDETHAAIPSLLAVSAVHHYLIDAGKRVQTALIVRAVRFVR